ncbi:hypothetical protein ACLX1H_009066 [Fusarium chlamydosporum]
MGTQVFTPGSEQSPATSHTPTLDGVDPKLDTQLLHSIPLSFAIDISGSTCGKTLESEKTFISTVSSLLSPSARFASKVLPWDNKAYSIRSVAQVDTLESLGGTDPGVLLSDDKHKLALKQSSLWFLMTDGLIPDRTRAKFANDIAKYGIHGISSIIVIFGDPTMGPTSCDISVGVSVFATVPNCAFLFCDVNDNSLRVMETKGCFDFLLKDQPHPVFDSSSRWDLLPQVSVEDLASVRIPKPECLESNQVALQNSLVINMDDLFANRLSHEQVNQIFSNIDNIDSVRMTSQTRNRPDEFRHWLHQQTLRPNDPVSKQRRDLGGRAESYFTELVDLISRGQPPPGPLQARLRAAYIYNMRSFGITGALPMVRFAENRSVVLDILTGVFEKRFAEGDMSQVFLSVLLTVAAEAELGTSMFQATPASTDRNFNIEATMAAAAAANTFRAAVEWTVRDLFYSVTAPRELSESFSLSSNTPAPVWPLASVLAGSLEELDSSGGGKNGSQGSMAPLLRYPLPGFLSILKAAPMLNVGVDVRRRAAFRRLLYLICEELARAAEQVPHSQSVADLFGGLLERPLSTSSDEKNTEWEPYVSVSIPSLRAHSLLSDASYDMMSRAEEFRYFEDLTCVWVKPALALFLHGLFSHVSRTPWASAPETFQAVSRMDLIWNALLRPEDVSEEGVRNILSRI